MSALSSNPSSADESSRAHDPSSAFRQQGDCPWCVLVSDNQRRMAIVGRRLPKRRQPPRPPRQPLSQSLMLKQLIQPLWFVRLQCSYEPPFLLRTRQAASKHSSLCPAPRVQPLRYPHSWSAYTSVKVLIEALTCQRIIDANILSPTLFEIFLSADQRDAMAVTRQALVHQAITKNLAILDL